MSCCCENIANITDVSKNVGKLNISTFADGSYQAVINTIPATRQYIQSISTVLGVLGLDMTSPDSDFWMAGVRYEVKFIQGNNYSNYKTFTMEGSTYDCLRFTVVKSFNGSDECQDFADQTAVLCNS